MRYKRCAKCVQTHNHKARGTWERPRGCFTTRSSSRASVLHFFPGPELDPGPAAAQLFTPTLSSPFRHGTPAHGVPGGSDGLACGPGSGVPRVCLQWRQLLQTHALPRHGHLLYDHPYLLHPIPDEGEEVMCAQVL